MDKYTKKVKRESTNNTAKKQKVDTSLNDKLDQENLGPSSPPAANSSKGDGASDSPKSPPLTPEQKQKVDENKLQAQMKRVDKETEGLVVNMGPTWFNALQGEFTKPYFLQLSKFVAAERKSQTIFPPVQEVFSFTTMCPISKIKVVILGQDPYHGDKQAHGLCFSVQKGITPPPSLKNMYKELCTDIPGFTHPGHGYLAGWAQQGVLLLNAVLTVRAHNANSHKDKGWEKFTDAVITHINKNMDGVVFMLWGAYAQKKGAYIDKKRHHILKGVHPSPLSAHRGYFGCKHFSKCNEMLEEAGKKPIDWKHLPLP